MRKNTHHEIIARNLRAIRLELGLSQSDLAGCFDCTIQQILKYENGSNRISAGHLATIAKTFDIPLSRFFEGCSIQSSDDEVDARRALALTHAAPLLKAFARVRDAKMRAAIVSLVELIAGKP